MHWVSGDRQGLSLVMASRGYFLVAVASLVAEYRLEGTGSLVVAQGSVTLRYVGSSRTRDGTGVCCVARQILNCWTTREAWVIFTDTDTLA